jgi:hypothetical protein
MLTEWRRIDSFPSYSVSNVGTVRNEDTGKYMALLVNQRGIVNVGLTKHYTQYKRAVGLLVAKAFIEDPNNEAFDAPINLDGDRTNNRVDNLLWRPRWFARKYYTQFSQPHIDSRRPVVNVETEEVFFNAWVASLTYGVLHRDVVLSLLTRSAVWPIRQHFRDAS